MGWNTWSFRDPWLDTVWWTGSTPEKDRYIHHGQQSGMKPQLVGTIWDMLGQNGEMCHLNVGWESPKNTWSSALMAING